MRRKKKVLLYCADELLASRTEFVLGVRGYAVTPCDSMAMVEHELDWTLPPAFDAALVLSTAEKDHGEAVVRKIRAYPPGLRVLLMLTRPCVIATEADAVVYSTQGNVEMVERLKVMAGRKRGPKTAAVLVERCATAETAGA